MELVELAGPSTAETFEAWATGTAAVVTVVAIFIGALWVLWRYVLSRPLVTNWEFQWDNCSVRRDPTGTYVYMINVHVVNASNIVCHLKGVTFRVLIPPQPLEGILDAATSAETTSDHVFVPNASRVMHINADVDKLCEVVVVAWKLYYERPQRLGLFGRLTETSVGAAYLPVDAESLSLYGGSPKEDTDH